MAEDRAGAGSEEGRRRSAHPADTQGPRRIREDVRGQADHHRAPRRRCDGEPQARRVAHAPRRYPGAEVEAAAPHHDPGPRHPGGARSAAAELPASAADRARVGDITHLPIAGGKFLYLATAVDVFSRRLPGWSMADHMRAELVTDALIAAVRTRGGQADGVIFHSDHGAQYGSKAFADTCHQAGILRSIGAVGRYLRGRRRRGVVLRLAQAGDPSQPTRPADRTSRPARGLPPARLLQPPAQALHDRLPHAGRLRTEINYAGHRCMTTGVHDQGGSPLTGRAVRRAPGTDWLLQGVEV